MNYVELGNFHTTASKLPVGNVKSGEVTSLLTHGTPYQPVSYGLLVHVTSCDFEPLRERK